MDNINKEISEEIQINSSKNCTQEKDKIISNISNNLNSINPQFITKGRKTVINSSNINLLSPKKENPTISQRMSLLRKHDKDIKMNFTNTELFSFGKPNINSSKKLKKRKNDASNNIKYKQLIKRISSQLKKRVKLPTCKIIKIYKSYRELIFRIAEGIKRTSKNINKNNINFQKEREKFGISLISKEKINNSKNSISNSKRRKEKEDNINLLINIDDTLEDVNYMNNFENFLLANDIMISIDTKSPSFNNGNNKYLLSNLDFWIKYIKYLCLKYKTELNFYNFTSLIELFYIWIDNNKCDSNIFKKLIIQQIELLFDKDKINKFLLTYKLNNLEELFSRYKDMNNINSREVREIKLEEDCQCPNCPNIKEKVINYNKKNTYISYSEENNLNYGIIKEIIKFPQTKIIYDDNQKGLSIPINSDSKIKKITDYYRCSIKKNPSKNSIQKEIIRYNDDKKITDYFFYKKGKINDEQKKENEEKFKKIKSKSSSSSNKKKSTKKYKKSKNSVNKEILELLNLEA